MSRTIAVTGATGFIGAMLVDQLLAADWQVRALVRPDSAHRLTPKPGLETVTGSLQDEDSLVRLVQDSFAVVHCAGAVRGASAADFDAVNVDGLERLEHARIVVEQTVQQGQPQGALVARARAQALPPSDPNVMSSSSMIERASSGSRLPVGSSASSSRGRSMSARATAMRCCSPPESSRG